MHGIKYHRSAQLADVSENLCPGQPKPCEEIRGDERKSSSVVELGRFSQNIVSEVKSVPALSHNRVTLDYTLHPITVISAAQAVSQNK